MILSLIIYKQYTSLQYIPPVWDIMYANRFELVDLLSNLFGQAIGSVSSARSTLVPDDCQIQRYHQSRQSLANRKSDNQI